MEVLTTVHRGGWTVVEIVQLVQELLQPDMNVGHVHRAKARHLAQTAVSLEETHE